MDDEEEEGERRGKREGRGTRRKKRPRMRKKRRRGRKRKERRGNVRKSGEAVLGIYRSIRKCISSHAILGYMGHYQKTKQTNKEKKPVPKLSHGHPTPYIP